MSDKNNKVNITSFNQMGGITAGTVNIESQNRQMNGQIGSQLKNKIPVDAKVSVTAVLGDGEAFGFANQIFQWMKSNGYENVTGVNQAVYTKPVLGQMINTTDDGFAIVIGSK